MTLLVISTEYSYLGRTSEDMIEENSVKIELFYVTVRELFLSRCHSYCHAWIYPPSSSTTELLMKLRICHVGESDFSDSLLCIALNGSERFTSSFFYCCACLNPCIRLDSRFIVIKKQNESAIIEKPSTCKRQNGKFNMVRIKNEGSLCL